MYAGAVKESLDSLPDGVCFFLSDGQPLLTNSRMQKISGELFGTEILNADIFFNGLKEKNIDGKEKVLRTEPTVILKTSDGKVWDFRKECISSHKENIFELIAYDITKQYCLHKELNEKNDRLSRVNERLLRYSRELETEAADKALLKAKIQVHDNVGRALLAFRTQYLNQPQKLQKREKLLFLWQSTIKIMKQEAEPKLQSSAWEEILKAADAIGVTIELSGILPENDTVRSVILSAAHECLTNTVKHAGGNRLWIFVINEGRKYIAEFTNNGSLPQGEIEETGGLKNLRQSVEKAGGIMKTESRPRFLLRIELWKGDDSK